MNSFDLHPGWWVAIGVAMLGAANHVGDGIAGGGLLVLGGVVTGAGLLACILYE